LNSSKKEVSKEECWRAWIKKKKPPTTMQ
jgi:hypothetical protein